MIYALGVFAIGNWLLYGILYTSVYSIQNDPKVRYALCDVSFGDTIETSSFKKTQDTYTVLNLLLLNASVYFFIWFMKRRLRLVYLDNLRNNKLEKEVNWMMSRTLEINGRYYDYQLEDHWI